jgi:hypothetical protein
MRSREVSPVSCGLTCGYKASRNLRFNADSTGNTTGTTVYKPEVKRMAIQVTLQGLNKPEVKRSLYR